MSATINPLMPAGYDIAWTAVTVLVVALTVVALVALARSAKQLTSTQALLWTLIVLLVPVIGPAAWLFIGRRAHSVPSSPSQRRS